MEDLTDETAEIMIEVVLPILKDREEKLEGRLRGVVKEMQEEYEATIERLNARLTDIEQWRKENDEQHLQKVLEEGMFSFKRKAPETAEIHIIEEGLSTVGCPTPVRLYANTGSKKKLSKSPVHSLRFNWMRDNPNGLRRIEEFCMDNAFSRDMPGKERCFHGGVDANLWRDTEEDMLRVYLKIDNICKNARNKELITDVE